MAFDLSFPWRPLCITDGEAFLAVVFDRAYHTL